MDRYRAIRKAFLAGAITPAEYVDRGYFYLNLKYVLDRIHRTN